MPTAVWQQLAFQALKEVMGTNSNSTSFIAASSENLKFPRRIREPENRLGHLYLVSSGSTEGREWSCVISADRTTPARAFDKKLYEWIASSVDSSDWVLDALQPI